jgi:hypothetical protein
MFIKCCLIYYLGVAVVCSSSISVILSVSCLLCIDVLCFVALWLCDSICSQILGILADNIYECKQVKYVSVSL